MKEKRIRLTYRLKPELYNSLLHESKTKGISVNGLINTIIWDYYNKSKK